MSTSTWVILGIIGVIVLWAIMTYNSLVAMAQRVNQSFADIDVQLKQRSDLIPNLVETVKGYAAHERGTLDDVVKARNAAIAAPNPEAKVAAENQLTILMRGMLPAGQSLEAVVSPATFALVSRRVADLGMPVEPLKRFKPWMLALTLLSLEWLKAGFQRHLAKPFDPEELITAVAELTGYQRGPDAGNASTSPEGRGRAK